MDGTSEFPVAKCTERLKVRIYCMKAHSLAPMRAGNSSNPYLELNLIIPKGDIANKVYNGDVSWVFLVYIAVFNLILIFFLKFEINRLKVYFHLVMMQITKQIQLNQILMHGMKWMLYYRVYLVLERQFRRQFYWV